MSSGSKGGGSGVARLLAVVASVALIAGGLLIRNAIDDDDDGGSDDPAGSTVPGRPDVEASDVICITELEEVCAALDADELDVNIAVEPAGTTLDALAVLDDTDDAPLWITIDPFPAMVDELRTPNGLDPIAYESSPVAASRMGIALPESDRWSVLTTDECDVNRVWQCVGNWAGTAWAAHGGASIPGTVRPATGDGKGSALGLAGFAAAVAGFTGNPAIGSISDLEANADFSIWLDGIHDTVEAGRNPNSSPLDTMIVRPSSLDVASTTSAEFDSANPARIGDYEIQYPLPSMWATAVLATPGSTSAPDELLSDLNQALIDSGWDNASVAETPLPNASIMLALRELWRNQ